MLIASTMRPAMAQNTACQPLGNSQFMELNGGCGDRSKPPSSALPTSIRTYSDYNCQNLVRNEPSIGTTQCINQANKFGYNFWYSNPNFYQSVFPTSTECRRPSPILTTTISCNVCYQPPTLNAPFNYTTPQEMVTLYNNIVSENFQNPSIYAVGSYKVMCMGMENEINVSVNSAKKSNTQLVTAIVAILSSLLLSI